MSISLSNGTSSSILVAPATKTASTYTVSVNDYSLIFNSTSTITVTLPSASANNGKVFMFKNISTGTVVSASSNVVPRTSATAGTAILSGTAGSWAMLHSDGTNWVIMAGA